MLQLSEEVEAIARGPLLDEEDVPAGGPQHVDISVDLVLPDVEGMPADAPQGDDDLVQVIPSSQLVPSLDLAMDMLVCGTYVCASIPPCNIYSMFS